MALPMQLVGGSGAFNPDFEAWTKSNGIYECSPLEYSIVAVMGAQSTGKSTLLNGVVSAAAARRGVGGGLLSLLQTGSLLSLIHI